MKAISINQPWAWLILYGGKWLENRTWRTPYRGRLAIHAGQSRRWLSDWYMVGRPMDDGLPPLDDLVFGRIIGTVELVDCVRSTDDQVRRSRWNDGSGWCWILRDPRAVDPVVYCRGRQRLFEVSHIGTPGRRTKPPTEETGR